MTIYVMPEVKDLGRGIVVDIDSGIINALKEHNLKCHPNAKDEIETLGLKCSEVISVFPNIDENIILGVNNRKLYVPYLFLNHP